jgi:DNA-directed RNA polymerase subunit M/transcription elongation factor TFIIS
MKCGKCSAIMKEKEDTLFGEKVKTYVCGKCGNKLIPLKEAIKVQQKTIPRVETSRKLVQFGGSIAVTLPKQLKTIFRKGEKVKVYFDPNEMELRIKKL